MTLYHSFETSPESKIIGVKDGLEQVRIKPERFSNKAMYEELEQFFDFRTYWQRTDHTPPQSFVIEYAKLRPKAKLTDFLEFNGFLMGCPFMLSGRAKEVFAQHWIQPSYLFDVYIYDETGLVTNDYSLFYFPMLRYEVVDFAKSRFGIRIGDTWQPLNLPTQAAYEEFRHSAHKIPSVESLVMNEVFDSRLDFFQCRLGPMFMSERLRRAVEKAGLTSAAFPTKYAPLAFAG